MSDIETEILSLIKHNENTLTNRANFFLLGESMLVAAYATLNANHKSGRGMCIVWLGLIISCVWLMWGTKFYCNTRKLVTMAKKERQFILSFYALPQNTP